MRKRIFEIIELSDENDRAGRAYDCFMMAVIVASLIPLAFKGTNTVFMLIEKMSVVVFVADYILRLITADYKTGKSLGGGGICFCTISIYADGIDRNCKSIDLTNLHTFLDTSIYLRIGMLTINGI